jgi:hypothetical protein
MKMENSIDEDLLYRLIEKSICTSETEAVETAPREMLKRYGKQALRDHFHMRQATRACCTHG